MAGGLGSSGQGNPLGNQLIKTGIGFGGIAPTPEFSGAQYTPVTPNVYQSPFSSIQGAPLRDYGMNSGFGPTPDIFSAGFANTGGGFRPNTGGGKPAPGSLGSAFNADLTYANTQQQQQPTADSGMRPQTQFQQPQFGQFQQPMMMPQYGGLQNLFNAMMMQQRMQPMRMPMYQSPALAYRPNMQSIQQNLSRVQPSVYKSDLDAARARIAELEGQRGGE